jgi:hypothetical protein
VDLDRFAVGRGLVELGMISSSGVPTMPRVLTSSRHGGTPHCMKNDSDAASIQRWKFG